MKRLIKPGDIFGNSEVIERIASGKKNGRWRCKCQCGNIFQVSTPNLLNPRFRGCGCFRFKQGKENKNWRGCGDISASYFQHIKSHAKRRKKEFTLTIEEVWRIFLSQDRKCVFTGELLTFPVGPLEEKNFNYTASLDRIDSNIGYVNGNVQWVHKKINMAKQALSDNEFIILCKRVADYRR